MIGGSMAGRSRKTDDGFDTTDSRHNIRHREPPTDRAACAEAATSQSTHQDTPPDAFARDRGVWQVSWLAGPSPRPPSRNDQRSSGNTVGRSPLTVAGAAAACTAFPFDPLREPRRETDSGCAN